MKTRLPGERGFEHFPADGCSGRQLISLVGRVRREHKNHFRKTKSLERFAREDEMGVMNRIERSAVNADFFQLKTSKSDSGLPGDEISTCSALHPNSNCRAPLREATPGAPG